MSTALTMSPGYVFKRPTYTFEELKKKVKETVGSHSPLGASQAERYFVCPGSVRLSKGIEKKSSPYAEEGTLAHALADYFLCHGKWPKGTPKEFIEPLAVYVEAVMADYIGLVKNGRSGQLGVEEEFHLSTIHPDLWGTADAALWISEPVLKLIVYDLKFGRGKYVKVYNNRQLLFYALGALFKWKVPAQEVELVIAQPRLPRPGDEVESVDEMFSVTYNKDRTLSRWSVPALRLYDFAAELAESVRRTDDPNAELVTGPHCKFCPAAPICPARSGTSLVLAQEEFSPALPYDPNALAAVLPYLDEVEDWVKNVRAFAYNEAERGVDIPGYKIVQKHGKEHWIADEETVAAHCELFYGVDRDEVFTKKLKTPKQVREVCGKGADLSAYTSKRSRGRVLVPDSDPRVSVRPDPTQEFEVLEPEWERVEENEQGE